MSNLTLRIVTAVVLVALILTSLFVFRDGAAQILLAVFLLIGAWEWSGFAFTGRSAGRWLFTLVATLLAVGIYFASAAVGDNHVLVWLALLWWLVAAIWMFGLGARTVTAFTLIAGLLVLLPAFYVVINLLDQSRGEWLFVWVVGIVAAADIGAYAAGKLFGKHKLAPRVSPGKTWEGLYGGLAAAVAVGAAGAALLELPVYWFAAMAGLIAPLSVLGDLTVSAFKRQAGLKDSGVVLPGHGGVLDRIDGLVAALPLFLVALAGMPGQ